jgi:L-ribulose-5-phosphate 3-epimerase UlaE
MGRRTSDGPQDQCLANLKLDEPFFVLRAQDYLAPQVIRLWAERARQNGCNMDKVREARDIADEMEKWPHRKMPD